MKFKNRTIVFSIFMILVFGGYILGKIKVGRRGDRSRSFITSPLPNGRGTPVAAATGQSLLPEVTQASVDLPSPPFLVSWCEGKNCEHEFSLMVKCKNSIFQDAKTDSRIWGELKPGEQIEARLFYTKIIVLGSYLPLEAPLRTLVSRAGPNLWVSFHDHAWDSAEWPADEYEKNPVYQVKYPDTEAWALIKTKAGLSGFVRVEKTAKGSCPFEKMK